MYVWMHDTYSQRVHLVRFEGFSPAAELGDPLLDPDVATCVATSIMLLMRLLARGSIASTPSDPLDLLNFDI